MTELKKKWLWVSGLFVALFIISTITFWNVLSDPEQVFAFNDANIEGVLSPTYSFPQIMVRFWENQCFFGLGNKQYPISLTSIGESLGPVFWRRTAQPMVLGLCGLAIFWALRQYRIIRPVAAVTAAILIGTGWGTNFAITGLAVRPFAVTFAFLAIGFAEQGRTSGRWLPYAIGGGCLGLGISEVPDVGAILAVGAAWVFWWTHVFGKRQEERGKGAGVRGQESGGRSQNTEQSENTEDATNRTPSQTAGAKNGVLVSSVHPPSSVLRRLLTAAPRFALFVAFSVLLAWQTLVGTIATTVQGVTQGADESPAARYAWATQWSLPPAELWNTVSGSYFGTTMRSEKYPYWGRTGRSEGWEKTKQGFRNFSLTGWHIGVIPSILLITIPVWLFISRRHLPADPSLSPGERVGVRGPCTLTIPPAALAWMVCIGCALALMLAVGKHFVAYWLIWHLPFFDTMRNPDKWNGAFLLCGGLGIAFMLNSLWNSLICATQETGSNLKSRKNQRTQDAGKKPSLAFWRALVWTSFGMAFFGLIVALWTQTDKPEFLEARARDGYGAAGELMWNNAVNASFKVFVLAVLLGGVALWFSKRIRQGKSTAPWLLVGVVAILALGDLMAINRDYSMPHKFSQYLIPNPLTQYMDAHRSDGRLKLIPPQHPLLNNLRLSLLQIKGYDLFEPVSMPRMPTDYAALFKAFESNPVRLWEIGAVRYFLTLPGAEQQLNQMDGNRGRFVERLATGVGIINDSYVPVGQAPADQRYLRLLEFTGALPVYRLVSKTTCLPDSIQGNEAALKRLSAPDFDIANEAIIHTDKPIEFPASVATGMIVVASHEPAQASLQVTSSQSSLLVRAVKYDPDWKVTLDGQPVPLHRVNFLFQGVMIPPGRHTVGFDYAPSLSASAAALASRGILLLLLTACVITRSRIAS